MTPLVEIKNLKLDFLAGDRALRAVDDVSLTINTGETVCLVGESGCGKSVTALSIAQLVPMPPARYTGGEILLNGQDVLKMSKTELRNIRGGVVSYIFQDPGASLNPVFRIGNQIRESLKLHRPEKATDAEVLRLLKLVGIPAPESRIRNYPFEMSGGMQQRVMIAMADRVAVMYAGQIVELAPARELLSRPLHPYTRALMNSVPRLRGDAARLSAIPGNVPRIGNL